MGTLDIVLLFAPSPAVWVSMREKGGRGCHYMSWRIGFNKHLNLIHQPHTASTFYADIKWVFFQIGESLPCLMGRRRIGSSSSFPHSDPPPTCSSPHSHTQWKCDVPAASAAAVCQHSRRSYFHFTRFSSPEGGKYWSECTSNVFLENRISGLRRPLSSKGRPNNSLTPSLPLRRTTLLQMANQWQCPLVRALHRAR